MCPGVKLKLARTCQIHEIHMNELAHMIESKLMTNRESDEKSHAIVGETCNYSKPLRELVRVITTSSISEARHFNMWRR